MDNIKISDSLFANIRYYVIGNLDDEVSYIIKHLLYPSVSFVIYKHFFKSFLFQLKGFHYLLQKLIHFVFIHTVES